MKKIALWFVCGFAALALASSRIDKPVTLGLASAVVAFGPVFMIMELGWRVYPILPDFEKCVINCK